MTRWILLAVATIFHATFSTTAAWMTTSSVLTRLSTSFIRLHSTTTTYTEEECQAIQAALPSPLIDAQGNVIEHAQTIASLVQGQRVALYFAAGWSRDCRELDFMLAQYRSALRDSQQPIQLIYVSSDNSQEEQVGRMQELGLELGVPLGEVADALKKQYGVWPDAEIDKFGGTIREMLDDGEYVIGDDEEAGNGTTTPTVAATPETTEPLSLADEDQWDDSGRRSGIPAFVVLDNKGQEFCFLNTELDSISALADWPLDDPNGHW
jgi:Thioredoxin-like